MKLLKWNSPDKYLLSPLNFKWNDGIEIATVHRFITIKKTDTNQSKVLYLRDAILIFPSMW